MKDLTFNVFLIFNGGEFVEEIGEFPDITEAKRVLDLYTLEDAKDYLYKHLGKKD